MGVETGRGNMKLDKNFLAIITLLAITGVVSGILFFRQMNEGVGMIKTDIPLNIGEWKGKDIELDEKTYKILETKNLAMREYANPSAETVYFYIVASDINRKVVHPPEICYTGGGNEISEKEHVEFKTAGLEKPVSMNSFVSMKDGRRESLVYYCYKLGNTLTTDYLRQQARTVLNNMMGKQVPAALVRVSTPIVNDDKQKASQVLQKFLAEMLPFIS